MDNEIIIREFERENKTLNLNLKKVENKQTYNTYNTNNSNNTTNTTISQNKGLFYFLFSIIKLPFAILYYIYNTFIQKTRFKHHMKEYRDSKNKRDKAMSTLNKLGKGFFNDDEIY